MARISRKSTSKFLGKWKRLSSEEGDLEEEDVELKQVLGLPLEEAVAADPSLDGIPLPAFFRNCLDFMEEHGLQTEGIYRLSPPKSRLDELERKANCGESLVFADPHDAAGLIKRFLRQIPEPIVPLEFRPIAESCTCGLPSTSQLTPKLYCSCKSVHQMKEALDRLPVERKTLFVYVFLHLQHVMNEAITNKMGLQALGLLFQKVLEIPGNTISFCAHAIRPCDGIPVEGKCYLVDEEDSRIIKYAPPLDGQQVAQWLNEDKLEPGRIHEELKKQQFLLNLLHSKISARHENGRTTRELDEHAWQVQNSITVIKRRLKQMMDASPPVVSLQSAANTRCIQMYEEKQLMANQGMLREDISEERQSIAKLTWQLQNLRQLRNENDEEEEEEEKFDDVDEQEWAERCKLEEAARCALLEEIGRLRSTCAELRARLEMESLNGTVPNYDSL